MRCRQSVWLGALPPAGRLLYCGAPEGARALEVHAPAHASVTIVNAEQADALATSDRGRFDVIVVDASPPRPELVRRLRALLAADGVLFLEHAQQPAYDSAKQHYREHGSIGPEPGTDSHLWFGGAGPPRAQAGDLPVIVSYFTTDTPYVALAERLRTACDQLGLAHHIVARPPRGSWEANCATKADVCLTAWHELRRPILWVDADAIVRDRPLLLAGSRADFAIHKWEGWQFASGTLFFGHTTLAERLLQTWVERCTREPRVFDQVHLDLAWDEVTSGAPLHTTWLPRSYCQIFDARLEHDETPVIEHFQASRSCKKAVTDGDTVPWPAVAESFKQTRRASRPSTIQPYRT